MPNSSTAIIASCASCASGSAGSSATSAARSRPATTLAGIPLPLVRATRSARSSSASAAGSFIPSTPQRWSASARQGHRALRVRCESLHRHQLPRSRWPVRAARQAMPDNPYDVTPCATSSNTLRHSPAVRSSAPMSIRDTAATTRKIPVASSSLAKARRLRSHQTRAPTSLRHRTLIGHLKAEGHLRRCYLKGRAATPPTSSSPPSVTTSASSSPRSDFCASSFSPLRTLAFQPANRLLTDD